MKQETICIYKFEELKKEVDETYAKNILNECKITDNYIIKSILKFVTTKEKPTLWDMFLRIIDTVEIRNFKSSVHRRKKLDLISERIFKYAIVSRLINA